MIHGKLYNTQYGLQMGVVNMNYKEIQDKIQSSAFDPGKIPEYLAFIQWLNVNGIDLKDIEGYQADQVSEIKKRLNVDTPKCPECSAPMSVRDLSRLTIAQNRDGYKTHKYCQSNDCLYEKYEK